MAYEVSFSIILRHSDFIFDHVDDPATAHEMTMQSAAKEVTKLSKLNVDMEKLRSLNEPGSAILEFPPFRFEDREHAEAFKELMSVVLSAATKIEEV